jgi:hypothetical protein
MMDKLLSLFTCLFLNLALTTAYDHEWDLDVPKVYENSWNGYGENEGHNKLRIGGMERNLDTNILEENDEFGEYDDLFIASIDQLRGDKDSVIAVLKEFDPRTASKISE